MKERWQVYAGWVLGVLLWGGVGYWLLLIWQDQIPDTDGRRLAAIGLFLWAVVTVIFVIQELNASDKKHGDG